MEDKVNRTEQLAGPVSGKVPAREDFDGEGPVRRGSLGTEKTGDWKTAATGPASGANGEVCLFSDAEVGDLRSRWDDVQAEFVDEPKRAVKEADHLVATVVEKLTSSFANERTQLEKRWDSGAEVTTEELRVALQRYRTFFGKLLNAA